MPRLPEPCRPVRRFRGAILLAATAATGVGAYLASRLELDSDLAALLPDSFASVRALDAMGQQVVWTSQLRVALQTDDFDAALAFARDVAPLLEQSRYVRSVEYENDVGFYERNALLFVTDARLDSLRDAVYAAVDARKQAYNPLMVDDLFEVDGDGEEAWFRTELVSWEEEYRATLPRLYYTNPAGTVLVLDLSPEGGTADLAFARGMMSDVRKIVDDARPSRYAPDLKVYYGGNIKNRIDELDTISSDILSTAAYGVSGVFLVVALAFRSALIALLISVPLVASLAWTFGATYLLLGQLNTITGFLFVVLFGLGVDFGIHAMARYREARQAGLDSEGAIHSMICRVGPAMVISALTTAAAFLSLTILDFRGFSELGVITAIGMVFAVGGVLVVLPALVIVAEDLGILRVKRVAGKTLVATRRPLPFARAIVGVAVVLAAVSALAFSRVPFQYDFTDLRIVSPERREYARIVEGVFPLVESPAVVLADSPEQADEVVAAVEGIIRTDTLHPTVESVRTVRSIIPSDQAAKLEKIRDLRRLVDREAEGDLPPRERARVDELSRLLEVDRPFGWEDFPEKDRARFATLDGTPGDFVLIQPAVSLRDGRNAIAFRDDVGTITGASGAVYHAASPNVIVADLLTMITRECPLAALLSLSVVFLIIFVGTGTLRGTLLITVPLVFGLLWTGGLMYAMGMQINFFNVVVFPSLVGIGVDEGVHIYHRFREEGPGSLPFVLRRTGMAVSMTTLTTIIGYAGLATAHHPGLRAIGILAIIGLTAAFLSALVVLPAMIEVFAAPQSPEALP